MPLNVYCPPVRLWNSPGVTWKAARNAATKALVPA